MKVAIAALPILTLAALAPAHAAPHEGSAFVRDYDVDGDGSVTRAEFDATRVNRYRATDADKDGSVSEAEYVAEYQARLEKQLAASNRSEEKKTEMRQRQMRQTHVRFKVLDSDKDGRMTQAEYDASGARAFAAQDVDKDGKISPTDVAATAARQRAELAKADS